MHNAGHSPGHNNPVIVIHSCNMEKVVKEANKQSYRYYSHEPPRTSAFVMSHINDIHRRKPTDDEMQTAFQAFKQDFHQINRRMQAKMERLKEYEINDHRWPINLTERSQN